MNEKDAVRLGLTDLIRYLSNDRINIGKPSLKYQICALMGTSPLYSEVLLERDSHYDRIFNGVLIGDHINTFIIKVGAENEFEAYNHFEKRQAIADDAGIDLIQRKPFAYGVVDGRFNSDSIKGLIMSEIPKSHTRLQSMFGLEHTKQFAQLVAESYFLAEGIPDARVYDHNSLANHLIEKMAKFNPAKGFSSKHQEGVKGVLDTLLGAFTSSSLSLVPNYTVTGLDPHPLNQQMSWARTDEDRLFYYDFEINDRRTTNHPYTDLMKTAIFGCATICMEIENGEKNAPAQTIVISRYHDRISGIINYLTQMSHDFVSRNNEIVDKLKKSNIPTQLQHIDSEQGFLYGLMHSMIIAAVNLYHDETYAKSDCNPFNNDILRNNMLQAGAVIARFLEENYQAVIGDYDTGTVDVEKSRLRFILSTPTFENERYSNRAFNLGKFGFDGNRQEFYSYCLKNQSAVKKTCLLFEEAGNFKTEALYSSILPDDRPLHNTTELATVPYTIDAQLLFRNLIFGAKYRAAHLSGQSI